MHVLTAKTAFKFFIQFCTYASFYCAICLSAGAYVTNRLARDGNGVSAPVIVLIAVAAFFGLFSFTMASLSIRFAFINTTNIENLRGNGKVYQLAIRIPLHQTPNSENSTGIDYETITFPLADPNFHGTQYVYENPPPAALVTTPSRTPAAAEEHKFAIVKTEQGENPWDTGSYFENFKSVMGDRGLPDWLLPLRLSPCCAYGAVYPVGPVVDRLRERLKK